MNAASTLHPPTELREKLAQLFCVRIGSNLPLVQTVEESETSVGQLLEQCCVGGLCLFNGGPDTAATLARLQWISKYPLLVATDMERGLGQQVIGAAVYPHAMAFGRLGRDAETMVETFARQAGAEALASGIQIALAPVADVNSDPRNPIIDIRAFRIDPGSVSPLVDSHIRGCHAAGLLATAKHFPGHGNTHQDSHDNLPSVRSSREEWLSTDLPPFAASIEAGVDLVMTAHVAYPRLDPSGLPATLSKPILEGVLRQELGFEGVIVCDSLLMAGVKRSFSSEVELAHAALDAGTDWLLDLEDPLSTLDGLMRLVEAGRLSEHRIDQSLKRVWRLKEKMWHRFGGASLFRDEADQDEESVSAFQSRDLAQIVALGAIDARQSSQDGPVISEYDRVCVVVVRSNPTRRDTEHVHLQNALAERCPRAVVVELGPNSDAGHQQEVDEAVQAADLAVVVAMVKPAAWHRFGLLPYQLALIQKWIDAGDVILAALGSPFAFAEFPRAEHRVCTYSDVPESQVALARWLCGERSKWSR